MVHHSKEQSLVELKKQQWAKERAELAKLGEMFTHTEKSYEKTSIRTYYSNLDLSQSGYVGDIKGRYNGYFGDMDAAGNRYSRRAMKEAIRRVRSPSLPPLLKGGTHRVVSRAATSKPHEEESSGYTSDSPHRSNSPDIWRKGDSDEEETSNRTIIETTPLSDYQVRKLNKNNNNSNCNSNSSGQENDVRVLRVAPTTAAIVPSHQYQPPIQTAATNRQSTGASQFALRRMIDGHHGQQGQKMSPDSLDDGGMDYATLKPIGTPTSLSSPSSSSSSSSLSENSRDSISFVSSTKSHAYVREYSCARGREERAKWDDRSMVHSSSSKELVKSMRSPHWLEKGISELSVDSLRDSETDSVRSHLRGQNVPVDPKTLADRVSKRRKALELQNAIKDQLRERERARMWEREMRAREERLEEEQYMQQMASDQNRIEHEQRMHDEKTEKERKKQELMRMALEKAEHDAKQLRDRRRRERDMLNEKPLKLDENRMERVRIEKITEDIEDTENVEIANGDNTAIIDGRTDLLNVVHGDDRNPVLIGTPIRLRRTDVSRPTPPLPLIEPQAATDESPLAPNKVGEPPKLPKPTKEPLELDCYALVLESVTPNSLALPIPAELLTFNNLNNNLHLAILLAQQQTKINEHALQLTTIEAAISSNVDHQVDHQDHQADERNAVQTTGAMSLQKPTQIDSGETLCKKCQIDSPPGAINQNENVCLVPHDRTFTLEEAKEIAKSDAWTITESFNGGSVIVERPLSAFTSRVHSSTTPRTQKKLQLHTKDVHCQTENADVSPACSGCCHELLKKLYLEEISTVTTIQSVKQMSKQPTATAAASGQASAPQSCSSDAEQEEVKRGDVEKETTTTTTTTTTTIRSKNGKETDRKLAERPKWGVNKPLVQYIKASERDPYYLKNRRKQRHHMRFQSHQVTLNLGEPKSIGDSNSNSTSSSHPVTASPPEHRPTISRNVCTEILPIKTDRNGKIFLNFGEASFFLKEDKLRPIGIGRTNDYSAMMARRMHNNGGNAIVEGKGGRLLGARKRSKFADVDTDQLEED